jgi:hypothetical protein
MVTFAAEAGAVNRPVAVMVPALADQVTVELKVPVPWTLALHCDVAPGASVAGAQDAVTAVMEAPGGTELLEGRVLFELPQAVTKRATKKAATG